MKKVLIVAKKSAYQSYFNEYQKSPLKKLLSRGDSALLGIRRSHDTHYKTLSHVKTVLKKKGLPFDSCFRGAAFDPKKYSLVITVGGDGTFLEASHRMDSQLILGVNSDKSHSVGKLCVADRASFEISLDRILRGNFKVKRLHRMKISFNGKALKFFLLNDLLVSHVCPGAMSHYVLKIGRATERQRSSGVWVSTAAGSTGAMHSAGGSMMPEISQNLQYLPRELFGGHGKRYRLTGGQLKRGVSLSVTSQMQEGMLYLDGAHHAMSFEYGDEIRISGGVPLKTVSFPNALIGNQTQE